MIFDFENKTTPLGVPVNATFFVRDKLYVVDRLGTLFYVNTEADDPDLWYWEVVIEL